MLKVTNVSGIQSTSLPLRINIITTETSIVLLFCKFSGLWYVAQKFDLSSPCWTYYFLHRNTTRKVIQSQNEIIDERDPEKTPGAVGLLEIVNSTSPGFMSVRFSDSK